MPESTSKKRDSNIGLWRFFKRNLRTKISWNDWALKHQLRVQLFTLVLFFFCAYFSCLVALTLIQYRNTLISEIDPTLNNIYQQRIVTTSMSAAKCYHDLENFDKSEVLRIAGIYQDTLNSQIAFELQEQTLVDQTQIQGN